MAKVEKSTVTVKKQTPKTYALPKLTQLPTWLPLVLFAILTVIFFREQLFGGMFFWEDFTEQVFPNRVFASKHISAFNLPFWNPYTFCGMPFFADISTGIFYPFHLIWDFISGGNPSPQAVQLLVIIHYFIAQVAMYFLCRHFKISQLGAMIAAVSFGFSATLAFRVMHPMVVYHLAWFPLVILFFHKGISQLRFSYLILSGLILGLSILSGHAQTTLYEFLFLGFFALWMFVTALKNKELNGAGIAKFIGFGALPFIIAAGLFAVQYFPSKELAAYSERKEIDFKEATVGSMQFSQIATAVVPKLFGATESPDSRASNPNAVPYYLASPQNPNTNYYDYWETGFYFGIAALILGIIGAIHSFKTRLGAFFIFSAIFGFLFALGSNGFLFPIFYNLPLFGQLRVPSRMLFFISLSMCILAGFGFDALWNKEREKSDFLKLIAAIAFPLLIAFMGMTGTLASMVGAPQEFISELSGFGGTSFFLVIIVFAILFFFERRTISPMIAGAALILIAAIDLNIHTESFKNSSENPADKYVISPELKQLLKANPPSDIFRASMRATGIMAMQRNQGLIDSIFLYEGYNQLLLKRRNPPAPTGQQTLDLLNMRYEIKVDSMSGQAGFAQRPTHFPRTWMTYDAAIMDSATVHTRMRDGSIDFKKTAVLEETPNISLSKGDAATIQHEVKCTEYRNNSLQYSVNTSQPGIFTISELYYPAWQAYLDGKPVRTLHAYHALRAVEIPAGNHVVEMKYESSTFKTGAMISGSTLLIAVLGMVLGLGFESREKKRDFLKETKKIV
ncbi:MAG: YfhO family protein [Bacteroidota bacterium]